MELLHQHCYGSTPGASLASPYTGHPTEQGTQLSLLAFSLDVTQQVLHKYSVSTAGMQKCGFFLLYHPPLPPPMQMSRRQSAGEYPDTPICVPLTTAGSLLSAVQAVSEVLTSSPRERIFHSRRLEVDTPHSSVLCRTAVWDTREARNETGRMELEVSKQRAAPNRFLQYLTHSLSRKIMKEIKRRGQFFLKQTNITSIFRARTLNMRNE